MKNYVKTEAGTFKLGEREFQTALAAGVADSWTRPEVAADRSKPVASVRVNGKDYDSFPKAWRAMNSGTDLDTASQIQKNRKALFAAKGGKLKATDGQTYSIIEG